MKKAIGLLLLIFLSCSKDDSIECVLPTYSDAYKYTIKPGTEVWIELGSTEARVQACMIPQEILETISTEGLFESLLNYPFIVKYVDWDEFQVGFENLKSENKAFDELYSREDIYQVISKWYGSISMECDEWIYRPENAPVEVELQIIEMIIFQNEFLNSLVDDRKLEIFKLVYDKLTNRSVDGEKMIATAILGKIMFNQGFAPFVNECNDKDFLKFFIESIPVYRPIDLSPVEIIEKYANDFYKII